MPNNPKYDIPEILYKEALIYKQAAENSPPDNFLRELIASIKYQHNSRAIIKLFNKIEKRLQQKAPLALAQAKGAAA